MEYTNLAMANKKIEELRGHLDTSTEVLEEKLCELSVLQEDKLEQMKETIFYMNMYEKLKKENEELKKNLRK